MGSQHPGVLHRYTSQLVAFEHTPIPSTANPHTITANPHTILWIGGLGDGLLTVTYPTALAAKLPPHWRLAQVILSSAYKGWATGSLKQDVDELSQCVDYFTKLRPGAKIVLMGHSTGCQDIMEYLVGAGKDERSKIHGAVLQAGVSDREAMEVCFSSSEDQTMYKSTVEMAREWVASGRAQDVLPNSKVTTGLFGCSMTAYRFLSLASPDKDGDDDYFSSDLVDERLVGSFGSIGKDTPIMFLFSGSDQHVPESVDKQALVERWTEHVKTGGGVVDEVHGGVVPGAHHNLEGDPENVREDLLRRVLGFTERLQKGEFET